MEIYEKIFKKLEELHMSQTELARKTGIATSTISDWKRKKTNPSADKILKICEVLHITPNELLAEGTVHDGRTDYVFALNRDEEVVLESFRSLESRQKERLLGYMTALKENK